MTTQFPDARVVALAASGATFAVSQPAAMPDAQAAVLQSAIAGS